MLLYFVVAVTTTQSIYINLQISFTRQYNAVTQFVLERKNCNLLLIRKKWPYSQNEQSSEKSNRFKYKVCAFYVLRENLSTSVTGSPRF